MPYLRLSSIGGLHDRHLPKIRSERSLPDWHAGLPALALPRRNPFGNAMPNVYHHR